MSPQTSTLALIQRQFLGWNRPALPEAVRRLAARYGQGQALDLGRVIVVVPGQRAGRRLQELLAFHAEDEHLLLTPPQVITEGQLPEKLYQPQFPFANDLVQDLVWVQALRDLPKEARQHVVPHLPPSDDAVRWLELAKVFRGVHRELAADGLDFAAVLKGGVNVAHFNEANRWEALKSLQQSYHDLLDRQFLWDKQTTRLVAIKKREIQTECDIILLGTVDLNDSLRQMLDQIADRVRAYIVAPEELADHFDVHGCLVPGKWCEAMIPVKDEQLCQVGGPEEQADAVSTWLATVAERLGNDEVAIGVPDESLVPHLQRQLSQCGVKARWVEGTRLAETAPYRLLEAAVKFADGRRYDDLAALLRHPDLEDWLIHHGVAARASEGMSLPAQLDRFYNVCLPSRVPRKKLSENTNDWPDLPLALDRMEQWLAEASATHALQDWASIFRNILGAIYGQRKLNLNVKADEGLHGTIKKLLEALDQLDMIPVTLGTAELSAGDAFQVAMGSLADETLPPPADPTAVEILGWLELPLDDSQALVVTSFNEGFVPKSTGADAFLPDRLRKELDLLHNERRYARDAYATCALCQSRQELYIVLARRDTKKDPLHPSRLLFACPDEHLVNRARKLFGKDTAPAVPRRLLLAPSVVIPVESGFKAPPPLRREKELTNIPVTQFKDYLACPYRYYLRHVKKLQAIEDAARELDGGAFGSLLHRVLGEFGRSPDHLRHGDRAQAILEFLMDQLRVQAERLYGADQRRPAIRLQLEQARQRLQVFVAHQVALVREGWRIVYAEKDGKEDKLQVPFVLPSRTIELVGRIDRIDFQESTRTIRILDYKTADKHEEPDKTHRKQADWIDLQLPLYRHLWRKAVSSEYHQPAQEQLGYFNVPKKIDKTGFVAATWDASTLDQADDKAREVIVKILNHEFAPMTRPAPKHSEDFAAICLDSQSNEPALDEEDEGEPG